MTTCEKAADGQHVWHSLGRCYHSHTMGGNDYEGRECEACGRFAHHGPLSFACRARRRNAEQMAALLAAEKEACSIARRKRELVEEAAPE